MKIALKKGKIFPPKTVATIQVSSVPEGKNIYIYYLAMKPSSIRLIRK
jgi:hypothetical protein